MTSSRWVTPCRVCPHLSTSTAYMSAGEISLCYIPSCPQSWLYPDTIRLVLQGSQLSRRTVRGSSVWIVSRRQEFTIWKCTRVVIMTCLCDDGFTVCHMVYVGLCWHTALIGGNRIRYVLVVMHCEVFRKPITNSCYVAKWALIYDCTTWYFTILSNCRLQMVLRL